MKPVTGTLIKRGKYYHAVWNVASKRFTKSTRKTTRRDAEQELKRIIEPFALADEITALRNLTATIASKEAELAAIEDERNPPLTIAQAWDAYERSSERPDSGERTLSDYLGYWNAFEKWLLKQHTSAVYMRDVTPEIAGKYATHLTTRGLSPNSFNKHTGFLNLIFKTLEEPARLTVNPWERMRRKQIITQSRRELTVAELNNICNSAEGELRLLLAIGIYTGLRLGDAATLRWGEVDLHRRIMRRIPNKTARRSQIPVLIPIHPTLAGLLNELVPGGDYLLPDTAAEYLRDPSALSSTIQSHLNDCGITTHKPGTGPGTGKRAVVEVGFHSLRHSFVSLARAADMPLAVVEKIVGHSNPAMTRHYSHVGVEAATSAVAALPAIGDTDTPQTTETQQASPVVVLRAKIEELAEVLNAGNWKTVKRELRNVVKQLASIE